MTSAGSQGGVGAATLSTATAAPSARRAAKTSLHIPSLDGIRAASFFLVFLAHAGLEDRVPGGFGVTVFFFLSGYLILTLMRVEFEKTETVSLRAFYLRRVLRILPPFYLVLTVATALTAAGVIHGALSRAAVAAQFLHFANYWIVYHGYDGQAPGTGVYWSLAVEEHFYLFAPWLYLLLARGRIRPSRQAAIVLALCALVLAWRCVLVLHFHAPTDRTYLATDTRVDSILFGIALALYRNPVLDGPPPGSPALWKRVLGPVAVAVLLFTFVWRNPAFRETARYSLQGLALIPLFTIAIQWPDLLPCRLLNARAVAFVGLLSYSLYLLHQVVIVALEQHLPAVNAVLRGTLALALSLAIAYAIYIAIERPCARLRKRLQA